MKRLVSLILALCILCGLMLNQVLAASTGQVQTLLESVLADFPVGSYFTTDGKKAVQESLLKFCRPAA